MPRPAHKPNTLPHFTRWCRENLVIESGSPLKIEAFQKLILAAYFAGVTEILVLIPKKNGKTTLFAAWWHTTASPTAARHRRGVTAPSQRRASHSGLGTFRRWSGAPVSKTGEAPIPSV